MPPNTEGQREKRFSSLTP